MAPRLRTQLLEAKLAYIQLNHPVTGTLGSGRLQKVTTPLTGHNATVTYSYDALGRVTGRTIYK